MDPVPDPILLEKFLGYSRELNLGPLGWQSDMLTTIPNRWPYRFPLAKKNLTSSTEGQANDDLCLYQGIIMTDSPMCKKCHWSVSLCFHAKTSQEKHKNRPQLLVAGPLILHDNACPYITDVVTKQTSRL